MNVSSKIMALTMTAMLLAAPAMAQNYSSGTSTTNTTSGTSLTPNNTSATMNNTGSSLNTNSNINSGSNVKGSSVNTGSNVNSGMNMQGTKRVRSGLGSKTSVTGKLTSLSDEYNGRITRSEFRKAGLSKKLFRKIDKNHNGIISQSELSRYENRNMGGVNRVKRY